MGSNLFIPYLLLLIIPTVFSAVVVDDDNTGDHYLYQVCSVIADKITQGSRYAANLHNLVNDLVANTSLNNGFMSSSKGNGSENAYGHALCRHDISPDACSKCLTNLSTTINSSCSSQEATIWHDYCLFTYSNLDDNSRGYPMYYITNESGHSGRTFRNTTLDLFYKLIKEVSSQGETMFAGGNATYGTGIVYAMVQCTGDQSVEGCSDCLTLVTKRGIAFVLPNRSGRVFSGQCVTRYEMFPFLFD